MAKLKKSDRSIEQKIINKIIEYRKNKENQSLKIKLLSMLVFSLIEFDKCIPSDIAMEIVKKSISTSSIEKINMENFFATIQRKEQEYLKKVDKRFVLRTSISINRNSKIDKFYFSDCQIIFEKNLPKKFIIRDQSLLFHIKRLYKQELPKEYLNVRVHVSAKSDSEAYEKAMYNLELLRGIWNLIENSTKIWKDSNLTDIPINKIKLGPVYFIHNIDGSLMESKKIWSSIYYYGEEKVHTFQNFNKIKNETKNILTQIQKYKDKSDIEMAIIRYSKALDEKNLDFGFINLWSVLELLTNTKNSFDETVKRVSFLYRDFEYYQIILNYLRETRNKNIHNNIYSQEIETDVYILKKFVEDLLLSIIYSEINCDSLVELSNILSFSKNISDLEKNKKDMLVKINKIDKAINYRDSVITQGFIFDELL